MRCWIGLTLGIALVSGSLAWGSERVDEARSMLRAAFPEVQFLTEGGRLAQVYRTELGYGSSVEQAADSFVQSFAGVFGVTPDELVPGNAVNDNVYTVPAMYDSDTGTYGFTVVYYRQYKGGLPVHGADLRLLVGNGPRHPLVLANSGLYDLGDFTVPAQAATNVAEGAAHAAAAAFAPGLRNFSAAELVVWAGAEGQPAQPRVALTFVADNGLPVSGSYQKWRFVAEAATGALLQTEDLIVNTDVSGSVHGQATVPPKADICAPEADTVMKYAKVAIGSTVRYTDTFGNFTIPNSGSTPVTVTSYMAGQYFVVSDQGGALETLTMSVTPPGPANFMHNALNTSEFIRAEVNGYVQANVVRDWALAIDPNYPVIHNQTLFPVNVDLNDTCNAYYDGASINFYRSGGGCPNTAFSNVIHHEYGHHLIASGGSGQGAYGEGMADCVAILNCDFSVIGYGFLGDCNSGIRDANNTFQYPCSGEIHYCGQLISGCVWSTRNALQQTHPSDYLAILSNLTLNSIKLHSGDQITPAIYNTFVALDGGPNGPHHNEITAGFSAHNMIPLPPPSNDACGDALVACPGQTYSGNTGGATVDGATNCGTANNSPDVWYRYTPATSGSAVFSLCGSGTNYDSVMSLHSGCPGTVNNTLACDDDSCAGAGGPSRFTWAVTAGTTYLIRISGWNGAAGAYALTITGPACQPTNYTLTVNVTPPGGGSVTLNPPGGSYPPNTSVQLTAHAAAGYHFDHWSGALSGSTNPATVVMTGNLTVTAVFGLVGDLNCDGVVDFGDIDPFVLALSDPAGYHSTYPNCLILNADCNLDGFVDFGDIDAFVAILSGGA